MVTGIDPADHPLPHQSLLRLLFAVAAVDNTMLLKSLALIPLLPPIYILIHILLDDNGRIKSSIDGIATQLLLFITLGILGHVGTHKLIPNIKSYMLKRGICGKDLGKKGTEKEDDDV